jgi:hypothetical protein
MLDVKLVGQLGHLEGHATFLVLGAQVTIKSCSIMEHLVLKSTYNLYYFLIYFFNWKFFELETSIYSCYLMLFNNFN